MAEEKVITEKRVIYGTLGSTVFGLLLFLICICTDHWVELTIHGGYYRNSTGEYLLGYYNGLWRICKTWLKNSTTPHRRYEDCKIIKFFDNEIGNDPEVNESILDYSRSETAFAIIALILALLANVFGIYAIQQVRYMFKRLAGMLYLMTAVCILVCLEVFQMSIRYEKEKLPERHPKGATYSYDWSFGLCWVVFVIYIIAPIVMFVTSRKRKGEKARSELEAQENEPVILGRVG